MKDKFGEINEGHYLELMDRIHVIASNIETHIMEHPLLKNMDDKKLNKNLHSTLLGIYNAYQRVGELDHTHNYKKKK